MRVDDELRRLERVRKWRDELLERNKVNIWRQRAHDEQDADRLLQGLVRDAEGKRRADAGVPAGASEDGVLDLARRDDPPWLMASLLRPVT